VESAAIVGAFERLRLAATFAWEGPSLVLADGRAESLVVATDVVGALALYAAAAAKMPTDDFMKIVDAQLNAGQLELRGLGALHVRDVRVTKVTCSPRVVDDLASQQDAKRTADVLRALHVVDTEVLHHENVFVARDATLTGVDFAGEDLDVGALIAGSTVVVGNRAGNDFRLFVASDEHSEAANVRIDVVHL
jgi:hypothetical protein